MERKGRYQEQVDPLTLLSTRVQSWVDTRVLATQPLRHYYVQHHNLGRHPGNGEEFRRFRLGGSMACEYRE